MAIFIPLRQYSFSNSSKADASTQHLIHLSKFSSYWPGWEPVWMEKNPDLNWCFYSKCRDCFSISGANLSTPDLPNSNGSLDYFAIIFAYFYSIFYQFWVGSVSLVKWMIGCRFLFGHCYSSSSPLTSIFDCLFHMCWCLTVLYLVLGSTRWMVPFSVRFSILISFFLAFCFLIFIFLFLLSQYLF